MFLGKHCSISGGATNACEEAFGLEMDTIQIFTKNQRQWKEKEITKEEGDSFKEKCAEKGIKLALSHTIYLINLASNDVVRDQSIIALAGEILRCDALGIPYTVLHPGVNKNLTESEAIKRISDALNIVFRHIPTSDVKILLENTAGQGTSIGRKFEHIKDIIDQVESSRLGFCFDTCHAFAAGYDIRTKTGMEDALGEVDKLIGIDYLKVFHMNDSKGDLASRIDRHEHIGKGKIGLEPFHYIMNNFPDLPKILETHGENNMDVVNLETLRGLVETRIQK